MKILILEDNKERCALFKQNFLGYQLTITSSVDEAIRLLKNNNYDSLFLDHDLGEKAFVDSFGSEPTGYDVAKWLSENPERCPEQVLVHSLNAVGVNNIIAVLPRAKAAPFLWSVNQYAI